MQKNINGYPSIDAFVKAKIERLGKMEPSFASLFSLMFSESENVFYEKSVGITIERITYGESKAICEQKACGLKENLKDAPREAVVGLYADNSREWIEAFWAILGAGFRPLLLNKRLDKKTLEDTLKEMRAVAVIGDGEPFSVKTLPLELPRKEGTPEAFGSSFYLMSSGTTESLKICEYTFDEILVLLRDSLAIIRQNKQIKAHFRGSLKQLAFLPYYHVFGFVAVYLWFGFFSRTFVHLNDLAPNTILNTVRRHEVTHIFAVPLFWNKVCDGAWATARDREKADKLTRALALSRKLEAVPFLEKLFTRLAFREVRENLFGDSIRFMITGGSEISGDVLEFFSAVGYPLANGYGMTEIGITSVELTEKKKLRRLGSVGKSFGSAKYRISEDGELLVSGSGRARTVREDGKVTDRPEWFNTHDLAREEDGRIYLAGRKDDVVISPTGENLNPLLLEARFRDDPDVREAALVSRRDSTGRTVPVLLLSVKPVFSREAFDALSTHVAERAGEYAPMLSFAYTTAPLISGDAFKLDRRRLGKKLEAGELALLETESDEALDSALSERLRALFAQILSLEEVADDADFFALGGTSLDYFALLSAIRDEFGVLLPAGDNLRTVRQIHDHIKELQP